jgi:hypothetical protein
MALQTRPLNATAVQAALTDGTLTTLVAAPGAGKHLVVYGFFGSNAGASLSTVDWYDNATKRFSFAMGANGGGFSCPLTSGWRLATNAPLKIQQSASVASYVSCLYVVEPD